MKRMSWIVGRSVALLVVGWAFCGVVARAQNSLAAEFVGSTPGGALVRGFLGGLATNVPCHCIIWEMTLFTNQNRGATYKLAARYRVPTRENPNQSEDGPRVTSEGTWQVLDSAKPAADAVVYRIISEKVQRSLSFVKVGENLLHLLNPDGGLMIGDGGWSYTLNRADRSEKVVDASVAMTAPDMSYKISPLATNRTVVFGVFEGRSPCHGIARELKIPQHPGCTKVKWRVTLYQNAETSAPTTYKVEGTLHRKSAREGTWRIMRGADPNAIVYQLDSTQTEGAILLLKADDNVLFFLDQNREPLVGNADFSYTLNRVASK